MELNPRKIVENKVREWQANRAADKEAYENARKNAVENARQQWAAKKANAEAKAKYGLNKKEEKPWLEKVTGGHHSFHKKKKHIKYTAARPPMAPQPASFPSMFDIPAVDMGIFGGGGSPRKRRGKPDISLTF